MEYVIIILLFCLWLFHSQLYRLKFRNKIPTDIKTRLIDLGRNSIKEFDVPVGAILVYNGEIIGEGYNTVIRDKQLSGHAEINALNMAFEKFDQEFFKLDRKKLILYSTYEPCEMCKGALIHYNVKNILFEERKPVKSQLKSTIKTVLYEITKRVFKGGGAQKQLFQEHPGYRKHHNLD